MTLRVLNRDQFRIVLSLYGHVVLYATILAGVTYFFGSNPTRLYWATIAFALFVALGALVAMSFVVAALPKDTSYTPLKVAIYLPFIIIPSIAIFFSLTWGAVLAAILPPVLLPFFVQWESQSNHAR